MADQGLRFTAVEVFRDPGRLELAVAQEVFSGCGAQVEQFLRAVEIITSLPDFADRCDLPGRKGKCGGGITPGLVLKEVVLRKSRLRFGVTQSCMTAFRFTHRSNPAHWPFGAKSAPLHEATHE